jgi:hypothetical protein
MAFPQSHPVSGGAAATKKSLLARFKPKDGEKKPKKEKKEKPPKKEKAPKQKNKGENKGFKIGSKMKKKPRAEYQAEIDELTATLAANQNQLAATQSQLSETQAKYESLRQWARSAPVSAR